MTVRANYNTLLSEVRTVNRVLSDRTFWPLVRRILSAIAANVAFFPSKRSHP